jgi:transposase-like protein
MGRASKFTDEQKMEIALELISGKMSHSEVCRKWDIGILDITRWIWYDYQYRMERKCFLTVQMGNDR